MMTKDTGGPAFPQHLFEAIPSGGGMWTQQGGMTLRQWFAGQALKAILANGSDLNMEEEVLVAYKYADFMIAEGGKSHDRAMLAAAPKPAQGKE